MGSVQNAVHEVALYAGAGIERRGTAGPQVARVFAPQQGQGACRLAWNARRAVARRSAHRLVKLLACFGGRWLEGLFKILLGSLLAQQVLSRPSKSQSCAVESWSLLRFQKWSCCPMITVSFLNRNKSSDSGFTL